MVRVCYPIGVDGRVSGSLKELAKFSKKMTMKQFQRLLMLQKFTNASVLVLGKNKESCLSSLVNNSTDFSYGYYMLDPNAMYIIHAPYTAVTVEIVSGYDVNLYEKDQATPEESILGLLQNFAEFTIDVYCCVMLLLYAISVLGFLKKYFFIKRKRYYQSYISHITNWRHLIVGLMFLFILSPFRAVFKSRQVVSSDPDVLKTYEQIITSGAKLISNEYSTNMTKLLEPIKIKASSTDITNRFWRYYQAHHERPGLKALFTKGPGVASKKYAFIGTGTLPVSIREIWCSWTLTNEYLRMFVSRDESQREELTGDAFRIGYKDTKFIALIKRIRAARLFYALQTSKPSYYGFIRLRGLTTASHRRKQLELCNDLHVEEYQRHETLSSDLRSFALTMILYVVGCVVSFLVFICEMKAKRNVNKGRRRVVIMI